MRRQYKKENSTALAVVGYGVALSVVQILSKAWRTEDWMFGCSSCSAQIVQMVGALADAIKRLA